MQLDVVFDHNSSGDLQHPSKIDFRHIDHLRQIFDVLSISNDEKNRKSLQEFNKQCQNIYRKKLKHKNSSIEIWFTKLDQVLAW